MKGTPCQARSDDDAELVGGTSADLDYSGGRKTHRFPPPYGLGSHSLTHRPTENPTGMTHWRGLQGILNHAPLCSAVQNDALKVNPLRDTPHPDLPQAGEGVFEDSLPYSGRVRVGSGHFFCHSGLRPGIALLNEL